MSEEIIGCKILFDPMLPEKEKEFLMQAIQRLRGIQEVVPDFATGSSQEALREEVRPRSPLRPPIQQPSQPSVRPKQSEVLTPPQPPVRPKQPEVQTQSPQEELEPQRVLIDYAIKWGVEQKKISWQDMSPLSAEQIVEKAFELLKMMPAADVRELEAKLGKF